MVASLAAAQQLCDLDDGGSAALTSSRRPIVLAPRLPNTGVAAGVAPGLPELGLLLPYSPLHHLLMSLAAAAARDDQRQPQRRADRPPR